MNFIEKLISKIHLKDREDYNLLRFVRSLNLSPGQKILDVGCGYAAKMELLKRHGYTVIGVDINDKIIAANVKAGWNCITVKEFNQTNEVYDVLLMSHVIEHFPPGDLLTFMDNYLDRLRMGGYLIIITPLYSALFYEDFDHVKPYHPTGIDMVFGVHNTQVQYYSRNKLELLDIWFRRGPFRRFFARGFYLKKDRTIPILVNAVFAAGFHLSFRLIGRTDGWMAVYRKASHETELNA